MRAYVILMLLCVVVLGQAPPLAPINLHPTSTPPPAPSIIPVPVVYTNDAWQAWYQFPPGSNWISEISYNAGATWTNINTELVYFRSNVRMVESGGSNWLVRMRQRTLPMRSVEEIALEPVLNRLGEIPTQLPCK